MREEESRNRMARIYAQRGVATDAAVRAKFDVCIQAIRELTGGRADAAGWHILADAAQIAADLDMEQAARFDEAFSLTIGGMKL